MTHTQDIIKLAPSHEYFWSDANDIGAFEFETKEKAIEYYARNWIENLYEERMEFERIYSDLLELVRYYIDDNGDPVIVERINEVLEYEHEREYR